jgi:hypothetical protein
VERSGTPGIDAFIVFALKARPQFIPHAPIIEFQFMCAQNAFELLLARQLHMVLKMMAIVRVHFFTCDSA